MTNNAPKISLRFATPAEIADWDALHSDNPAGADFTNTTGFATAKSLLGWSVHHLVWTDETTGEVSANLAFTRWAPLLGEFWYIPAGPSFATDTQTLVAVAALEDFVRHTANNVFAVTFEPSILTEVSENADIPLISKICSASKSRITHKPGIRGDYRTAFVNLDKPADELLASFDKKCRNMVRRAERDGAEVVELPATEETFEQLFALMHKVGGGNRDDLNIRPKSYYFAYWKQLSELGIGKFYGMLESGSPSNLAFVVILGKDAIYKDGGSERTRTLPGAGNFLQWQMMLELQKQGVTRYNMFGIAPEWAKSNEDHVNYSLGEFKLSFARERSQFIGAFDMVLDERKFKLWRVAGERIIARLHRKRYHDTSLY